MGSGSEAWSVRAFVFAALILAGAGPASADPAAPKAVVVRSSPIFAADLALEQFKQKFELDDRTIDWETVPDQYASPAPFPTDFFNREQLMGVVFTTTGMGEFRVSSRADNPSGTPLRFGDIDPAYEQNFVPWSPDRIFAPRSGNVFDIDFFVPGTPRRALVRGFGAMFTDVEIERSVTIECFHGGSSLGVYDVPVMGFGRHAFVGVFYGDAVISRVRVTMQGRLGDTEKLTGDDRRDLVALDDIVFSTGLPAADLAAELGARREGDEIVYSARVSNGTSAEGRSVKMEQTLPSDVTVVSIPPDATHVGNVVSWEVGAVPTELTRTFETRVTANAVGLHGATLLVRADNDSDLLDNTATLAGVPLACVSDVTFAGLECRLAEMRDVIRSLGAPRRLTSQLTARFVRARTLTARARILDASARRGPADARLGAAARVLGPFRFTLGSKSATKFLTRDVRLLLESRGFECIFDLRNLRDR